MELTPIAYARNGFTGKFGIPRQVRQNTCLRTRIVFCPPFRSSDAIRGIEEFSHLWLIWGFHANEKPQMPDAQKSPTPSLTVRPPRLGGNTRMGVFATRSPFRPNPLGLTSVRLVAIEHSPAEGDVLIVEGADMLDGTPVYDIKPYIGYADCHTDTRNGFVDSAPQRLMTVIWQVPAPEGCPTMEINEILEQDPRPAYHDDPERIYGIDYAGWNIHFRVSGQNLTVIGCAKD